MIGKFIGKDAMGFKHGATYNIRSDIQKVRIGGPVFGEWKNCICIYDINSKAWCPYSGLETVLRNWEIYL